MMNMMKPVTTATTTPAQVDPLARPRAAIGALDADAAGLQRAATEGRLEVAASYSTEEPTSRASLIHVTSGVLAFVTTFIAVPLVIAIDLSRTHANSVQIANSAVFWIILVNVAAGFATVIAHEALHALACRLLGGRPVLTQTTPLTVAWSAPGAAFGRRSYVVVTLAPLVIVLVIWIVLLVALPAVAGFLLAVLVVNMAASGADLWIALAALQQPANAALFADTNAGFVAYAVTAVKATRRKATAPVARAARPH
jgi:hypothetical protein